MQVRWIFFDIGYTLINEDPVWQRRFEEQAQTSDCRALGLTPDVIRREVELNTVQRRPPYRSFIQKYGLCEIAPYRNELEFPYADAPPVLTKLSSRYRLGIIANQVTGLEKRLADWGLLPFLTLVVSSAEQQVVKPDRRLFEIALKQAGCRSNEAVMVGDRLDNDILPAKALGMHTVWIQQGFAALQRSASVSDTPDHIITRLSQLLQLY